jgi:proline iminopeptidase
MKPVLSIQRKLAGATAFLMVLALTACGSMTALPSPAITSTAVTETPAQVFEPITGLQSVNGTHLYYEIIGQGAPLIILHGGPGGSHRYFLPYMTGLANEYQLFFYDQRGTGQSDGQLDLAAITIDQYVEDLEAMRSAFGLENISLMGHSWGAIFALAYAYKYPEHLDHLILVDPIILNDTFMVEFNETLKARVQKLSAEAQGVLSTTCTHPVKELSPQELETCDETNSQLRFFDPAKAAKVEWAREENTINNTDTLRSLLTTSFHRMQFDLINLLPTVNVPTLIIHGSFDPIPVEYPEYLHQQIPGSEIVIIQESGHFPFIEQPEQFIAAVREFLQK